MGSRAVISTPWRTDATPKQLHFGEFLGINLAASAKRVAVVATGGLSHWPGEAKHGKINIHFDRKFLDTLISGDRAQLSAYSHEEINIEAGSGGHEIRTWIALAERSPNERELLARPVVPGPQAEAVSQPFLIPGGIRFGSRGMRFAHSVHGGVETSMKYIRAQRVEHSVTRHFLGESHLSSIDSFQARHLRDADKTGASDRRHPMVFRTLRSSAGYTNEILRPGHINWARRWTGIPTRTESNPR
jgi:hypothetical protein